MTETEMQWQERHRRALNELANAEWALLAMEKLERLEPTAYGIKAIARQRMFVNYLIAELSAMEAEAGRLEEGV